MYILDNLRHALFNLFNSLIQRPRARFSNTESPRKCWYKLPHQRKNATFLWDQRFVITVALFFFKKPLFVQKRNTISHFQGLMIKEVLGLSLNFQWVSVLIDPFPYQEWLSCIYLSNVCHKIVSGRQWEKLLHYD